MLPAGRSPFLPLGMTTTVTGLLCWRDLHPLEWQLASLHENRIKECQIDMFADRTPAATMRTNQLRLWFASMAYVLMCALRRIGLAGSELARATCGTIRLKLLKIGAQVTISLRRVKIAFASSYPGQQIFALAHARLKRAAA
jgi:Transposase DDE domain group 1